MEIRLEKPALNNFKAYGGKNEQLDGRGGGGLKCKTSVVLIVCLK